MSEQAQEHGWVLHGAWVHLSAAASAHVPAGIFQLPALHLTDEREKEGKHCNCQPKRQHSVSGLHPWEVSEEEQE